MDDHTRENSIRVLKKLRDVYQSQLDTSVIVELEAVIDELEGLQISDHEAWASRTLRVVADVIQIVTNISGLLR